MFVFMANHEIVATHSKPRHLVKRFLVISKIIGGKKCITDQIMKKKTYWVVGIQVYKFV